MTASAGDSLDDLVLVERGGGIATIILNRPSARNAISSALLGQLRAALRDADADESVGAVILTGADPAFCAGLDLKELGASAKLLESAVESDTIPTGSPWKPLSKPVIGAVNGVAITGGLELALNCDLLIASELAAFADTHTRVGVLPGWGLSVLLPQRVGFAMAKRMSFTGDFMTASEALRAGLVTEVVAHEELLPAARRVAAAIVSNNAPALRALLASYRDIAAAAAGGGMQLEAAIERNWRASGGSDGVADRVPGVFSRGKTQIRKVE